MLNYETLLSSYDDKLTLMQWLKKVEEALKDASATSFDVIKTGNATLKFAITFEDGTSLVSDEIVLQQGESVASGDIRNGHLYLTLTNGQELDCGLLFNGEIPSLEVRSLEVTGGLLVGDDANAAIGGDLVVHGLTEVQNLLAYGHVETETLTAAGDEIKAEKPVVEDMTGYSYIDLESVGYEKTYAYAGCCKNGNKITFAVCLQLKKTSAITATNFDIGQFNIPVNIGQKLYEVQAGTYSWLDNRVISVFENSTSFVSIPVRISKIGNDRIRLQVASSSSMQEDVLYTLRYEITFLLSENLAA